MPLAYARDKGKKAIALVESGVQVQGMYEPHERLTLEDGALVERLLDLSETIAIWRDDIGRTVKVQILPQTLAHRLGLEHAWQVTSHCQSRRPRPSGASNAMGHPYWKTSDSALKRKWSGRTDRPIARQRIS